MDTTEQIRTWLKGLDERIYALAANPAEVKGDRFLRDLFALAFPPDSLPAEIKFQTKGERSDLKGIAEAHHPYYLASTTERTKINPETGERRVRSRLVLRLKDPKSVAAALKDYGFLRTDDGLTSRESRLARRRGTQSGAGEKVTVILKLRRDLRAELQQLEDLEKDYRKRGDVASERRCQEERKRITRQLEHLGSGL